MTRAPQLLLTSLLAVGACRAPEDFTPPPSARQAVSIHNPERAALVASCPDLGIAPVQLDDRADLRLELPLGRWQLEATLAGRTWPLPLPLPAAALRPAVVQLTVTSPPADRPGLAWIPAGPALIGDVLGVGQEDERPARVLTVPGFWIARTETTNAEFAAFLDGVGDVHDDWLDLESRKCRIRRGADGHFTSDAPDLPVVTVSHAGAMAFCAFCTATTGLRHRLPSEVEWEKAARGPASSTYDYGDVFRQDAANQESGRLQAVASFPPHGFGVCDLTGNAFEWTADPYRRDAGDDTVPASAQAPYFALRGGAFVLDGMFLRNSMRMKLRPTVRTDDVGFRFAVEPREMN